MVKMPLSWTAAGIDQVDKFYWAKQGKIPIGTIEPYEYYGFDATGENRLIPNHHIVTIPFNKVGSSFTENSALTVLSLGGSGDGKGLIQKIAISVLQAAGYRLVVIDPLKFESGRMVEKWTGSPRLPPKMLPMGVPRHHFIPSSIVNNIPRLEHNFRKFSIGLDEMSEREFWRGAGMTRPAASFVSRFINGTYRGQVSELHGVKVKTFTQLYRAIGLISGEYSESGSEEMPKGTADNARRVLDDLRDIGVVSDDAKKLDMWREWNRDDLNKVLVVSYKTYPRAYTSFHIGYLIWRAGQYHVRHDNKRPIMFFLDDAKEYAESKIAFTDYNLAIEQIEQIGFNYRGAGVYDWLSVQSLGIIDQTVAETFNAKLISPYFKNPSSLRNINIPDQVIQWIENNVLVRDKERHLIQWVYVDQDNKVTPFFPFTPPCNHFSEIYRARDLVDAA